MTGVVLFLTDFLIGGTVAVLVTLGVAVLFAVVWYLVPLRHLIRARRA